MSIWEKYAPFIIRNDAFECIYIAIVKLCYLDLTHSKSNVLLLLLWSAPSIWSFFMPTFLLFDTKLLAWN